MRKALLYCTIVTMIMMFVPITVCGADSDKSDDGQWKAGQIVSDATISARGGKAKWFSAETIPDNVWKRMQGKSYKENPHIKRTDLMYLKVLHWDYDNKSHTGEMVCNKKIANILLKIFRQLYDAKYPIQRMVLPDDYNADDEAQMRDNNTSCFCYRVVAGSNTLSKHSMGLAVDINTLYNPYVKIRKDGSRFVQPSTATQYCNRTKQFRYKIDKNDLCYRLFISNGFRWGGAWKTRKDYQHFEYINN